MKKFLTLFSALILLGSLMTVSAEDYYLAGSMNGWDTKDNANKMSQVSGNLYSKTIEAMAANTYEFKISMYNWGTNWGGSAKDNTLSNVSLNGSGTGNISFTTTTACNVTFYFDAGSTKKIYVRAIPTSTTYTVVGDNATLFGSTWTTDATANDMALQSDGITYVKTYSNVHLTAGTINYKVAAAHAWSKTGEYPTSGNKSLSISSEGNYNVTFTYVPSNISLTAEVTPIIKMHGNFLGAWANTDPFVVAPGNATASLTLNIPAKGTKEFGMRIGADNNWTSNGAAITRESVSAAITSGSGNCTFNADIAGNYTFTWTYATNTLTVTYPDLPAQMVEFDGLSTDIFKGTAVNFAATSTGITNPVYTYYVKPAGGEYGSAVSSYTFDAAGTYTIKVSAEGDNTIDPVVAEQNVTVYNPLTLYFVNKEDWANVNLYLFDPAEKATWPGDPMTLTAETTDRNGYSVYSFVIPAGVYAQAIFNNGSAQTSDLTIDNSKPYYYDGEWYATLAECDQPVLTTNFYLAGSFNDWNTTSDRFMKVNESDTEASVTISITEYSNITFKVMEGAAYCGSSDAITKDASTATIAAAGAGNDIAMTPYAAGDYIFTLNLNTRVLTVTYPDGDAMPIPTNIFLAGEMNSWAPANNDYKFAVSGDIATLEVDLPAEQDYEFKLVYNSTWLRADYDFKYYWCSDVAFSAGDGDGAKIYTFKAGTYTFSYKISTGELSIAYPTTDATPVTIGALEYATFFSNKAFDVPADVEAYIITGNEGIKLTIEPIYRIPANTGVMLHAPAGTYNFYEGDGRWMDAVTNNKLKGSVAAEVIDNGEVHYVLSYNNDNQVGFYWPNGTSASQGKGAFTNGAGKAYLELSDAPAAAVVARRGFPLVVGAGTPTGIEDIESNAEQTKFIYNGQLLIQHNGLIFNAQGARVR